MEWVRRVFHVPATETQTGVVLAVCIFAMSIMSIVLVWQAQVIANENAVIHMFESRFGGSLPQLASPHAFCLLLCFSFFLHRGVLQSCCRGVFAPTREILST